MAGTAADRRLVRRLRRGPGRVAHPGRRRTPACRAAARRGTVGPPRPGARPQPAGVGQLPSRPAGRRLLRHPALRGDRRRADLALPAAPGAVPARPYRARHRQRRLAARVLVLSGRAAAAGHAGSRRHRRPAQRPRGRTRRVHRRLRRPLRGPAEPARRVGLLGRRRDRAGPRHEPVPAPRLALPDDHRAGGAGHREPLPGRRRRRRRRHRPGRARRPRPGPHPERPTGEGDPR